MEFPVALRAETADGAVRARRSLAGISVRPVHALVSIGISGGVILPSVRGVIVLYSLDAFQEPVTLDHSTAIYGRVIRMMHAFNG